MNIPVFQFKFSINYINICDNVNGFSIDIPKTTEKILYFTKTCKDIQFSNQIEWIKSRTFEASFGYEDVAVSIAEIIDLMGDYKVSKRMLRFLLWLSNLTILYK